MAQARRLGRIAALTLLLAQAGCLDKSYQIPTDELRRLVAIPPEERGRAVHAVQRFSTSDEPPPAPAWAPRPEDFPPGGAPLDAETVYAPVQPQPQVAYFYVIPTFYLNLGEPTYYARSPALGGPAGPIGGASFFGPPGSSGASARGDSKSQAAALAAAAVAAAFVFTFGLAASEGARYDGIVAVHPHHPVHLIGRNGSERLVGLDDLTLADVDPRRAAVIVADEGAGLWRRGRLPLDRRGLTWQFGGGWMIQQVAQGRALDGFLFHAEFGGFLSQTFGVVGSFSTGAANDWATRGDMWFARFGADLIWLPIHLGAWHFGPRFGGGFQYINTGGGDWGYLSATHPYVTAGVESEIAMTTRLAFSIRAGGLWQPSAPWSGAFTPAVQLGLNVY